VRSAVDAPQLWSRTPRDSSRPSVLTVALVFLACVWTVGLVSMSIAQELLAWDVRFAYLPAAEALLDGRSPYPALDDPILLDQKGYVYPPQLLFLVVPLTYLPVALAAIVVAVGLVALVIATLRILGVTDLRCYAAAFLWMPTMSGVLLANVSIPLAFAAAVIWRHRDTVWPPAVALGLAVSAKLLFWPLFVWTVVTGRLRVTAWAIAIGAGVTLAAWAAIGFDGLAGYPDLLQRLSEIQAANSYSFVGMADVLGLPEWVGTALMLSSGGALVACCVVFARRGDDFRSYTAALGATLALSPIVWLHYLVVLLVPMAIARPRFTALWLLPVLLWTSPKPGYAEGFQTFLPAIAVAILLVVLLGRPRRSEGAVAATA
jgi:alpha-1,2-mannosyltransferase